MTGCCDFGCTNRLEKGFIMKAFPKDPIRRKQWVAMVKREGWSHTAASKLCEAHFEPHMWEKVRWDGKRIPSCNAFPTIFSLYMKHVRKGSYEVDDMEALSGFLDCAKQFVCQQKVQMQDLKYVNISAKRAYA